MGRDGRRLGTVERIVVDERAHRVTHVVVGGRLVGVRRLRDAGPDGLAADLTRDQLRRLPSAEHGHVGAPGEHWRPPLGYRLENFLAVAGALIGQTPYVPPVHIDEGLESVHEITTESPVWSGRRRIGEVEGLVTDESGRVTGLVIRRDGLIAGRALLPVERVTEVVGNNVHTDLGEGEEDQLEEYRETASG